MASRQAGGAGRATGWVSRRTDGQGESTDRRAGAAGAFEAGNAEGRKEGKGRQTVSTAGIGTAPSSAVRRVDAARPAPLIGLGRGAPACQSAQHRGPIRKPAR